MSGNSKLTGSTADKAKTTLKIITEILNKNNINYCLDGGTLLGIAREGRLLPWDTDMDLFIPSTESDKLKKCILKFWLKGYRVRVESFDTSCGPAKEGDLRIIKIRDRKNIFSRGNVLLDLFIKYSDDNFYYWSVGKAPNKTVTKKVPRQFYDNLSMIEFDKKKFPAPADLDGYLTYRYGDWRTPVKVWDYLKDDLAINNKNMEKTSA